MSETISFDRTGMPLIWIPSLQTNVSFFPTTKISFEYFLCDRTAAQSFDNNWYSKILQSNKRVPVDEIRNDNFEGALITGVTIDEIGRYSRWLGQSKQYVRLPSNDEWTAIYHYAISRPPLAANLLCPPGDKSERISMLLKNLSAASETTTHGRGLFGAAPQPNNASTLARQMLMSQGIGEWVIDDSSGSTRSGARGGLLRRLDGDGLDPSNPRLIFKDRDETRPRFVGFRLVVASRS